MTLTPEQLKQAMNVWTQRLSLRDWHIRVSINRSYELGENTEANCSVTEKLKRARIRLLDPLDWPRYSEDEQDHEQALVHELLHIPTWRFMPSYDTDESAYILYEQFIDQLATALVDLGRVIKPIKRSVRVKPKVQSPQSQ